MKAETCKYFHPEGMKVLVVKISLSQTLMYLFYKVGSRNEYQGITGLSLIF
jgi:predicted Zn-dependent peptidase